MDLPLWFAMFRLSIWGLKLKLEFKLKLKLKLGLKRKRKLKLKLASAHSRLHANQLVLYPDPFLSVSGGETTISALVRSDTAID